MLEILGEKMWPISFLKSQFLEIFKSEFFKFYGDLISIKLHVNSGEICPVAGDEVYVCIKWINNTKQTGF